MADPLPPTPDADAAPTPTPAPPPADDLAAAKAAAESAQKELEKVKTDKAALKVQVEELKSLASSPPEAPKDLQRLHLLQIQPVRDFLVFLLILGIFRLGYTLRAVTIPVLLALTLAYLVEPVVKRVVRRGTMSRAGAAATVILIVALFILGPTAAGISFGVAQAVNYSQSVRQNITLVESYIEQPTPDTLEQLRAKGKAWAWTGEFLKGVQTGAIKPAAGEPGATGATGASGASGPTGATGPTADQPAPAPPPPPAPTPAAPAHTVQDARPGGPVSQTAASWLGDMVEENMQALGRFFARQVVGTGESAVEIGLHFAAYFAYAAFSLFLILFFFFFFCTGYERVAVAFTGLIPKWRKTRTLALLAQMDEVIAGFVRGRLIIAAIMMAAFTVGYGLIGVPAFLILGPITGVLAVLPYISMVSIPISIGLLWLRADGPQWQQSWWWVIFAPIILYSVLQIIDDYVLTPLIQGKTTQMNTPTILFAVLAGGIIAGFYGILLAIPAAACLKILVRESFWPRFKAWAEGRVKDFLPVSRYDPTETAPTPAPNPPAA